MLPHVTPCSVLQVARDVHFGDLQCYGNTSEAGCSEAAGEAECGARPGCSWDYSGLGYQYQVGGGRAEAAADPAVQLLAGPAFVAVFSVSGVLVAVTADRLRAAVSRVVLVGLGTATFSAGEQPLEAPRVTCPAQRVC